jgi:phage-related protein
MADTPTMEVRARLTADSAQFVQGMNNATAAANQLTSTASRVNGAMAGIGVAAAAGMGGLIALGVQSFMAAARVQELDIAINAVGKSTGLGYDAINAAAHGIKDMGIEMAVAQRSALMFAQNNLKLADASKLARTAQDLAVLSGKNSTEEFQLLTYAVMTQRSELFKSAGVNGSVQGAYQKMAQTLGKSTASLTAAEKVQAAMNMALEEGAKVAGTYEAAMTSPGKVLRSFARLNNDLMVAVGGALLKGIGPMIVSLYQLEKTIVKAAEGSGAFHDVITALSAVMVHIFTPISNFIDKLKGVIEKFDKTKINTEKLAGALNNILPILLAVGAGFATFGGAAIFKMVPVLGTVLAMLNPFGVALAVLALTSTKVRQAFINLAKALAPVANVAKTVGFAMLNVLGYAVGAVSKIINGLAVVVRGIIGFIERFAGVFKALGVAVGIVAVAFGTYKLTLMAIAAWQTISTAATVAYGVALDIMAGISLIAEAATGGLTAAFAAFNAILELNPIITIVSLIFAFIAAMVVLYNTNDTARKIITIVFNTIMQVVGTVVGTALEWIGHWLVAFGSLMDTHTSFGKTVANVFQFIYTTVLTVVQFVLKYYKFWLDAFVSLFQGHSTLAKIVANVFKFVAEFIGGAINIVLQVFANVLKGVATLIHWFGMFKDFIGDVWGKVVSAISTAAGFIANIVKIIANETIGKFMDFVRDKLSGLINWLASLASKIPGIGGAVSSFLEGMARAIKGTTDAVKAFDDSATNAATSKLSTDAVKSIDAITSVGLTLAKGTQSWGNYTTGAEGALSTVANAMSKVGETIVKFTGNLDPLKAIDLLVTGASKASDVLGFVIDKLSTMKEFQLGSTLVDSVGKISTNAGKMLLSISAGVQSFLSGDVLGKITGGIGDLVASLKETVGFGDILAKLKETFKGNPADKNADSANALGKNTAADIKNKADQMQKIRDAMTAGLDSIRKVMDDLQQAAKDFANSLKDTIIGFAGLKGVQLPDGFIPQAKSLIENMQEKLNRATQFSSQIAQLQALNLDAGALKQIIEAGPIQGAQLAASILGGGQEAVDQVSSLQKAIEFAGAAIGQQGVVAAGYPAMIANAQSKYNSIASDATVGVGGNGTNVNIQQGAFQISIDTSKATTTDEATKIIEDAINAAFATLGKELAAK